MVATASDTMDYGNLRAEIWRLAADPLLTEKQIIQRMLEVVGPALQVSRACFVQRQGAFFTCTLEWCRAGVKPSLGSSLPSFITRHFIEDGYGEITLDNALSRVPAPLRPVAWPLLRGMATALNLQAVYLVAYRVGETIDGCLVFDVCNGEQRIRPWSAAERDLVCEAARIVVSTIARKRAEERLRASEERYRRLFEQSNDAIFIHDLDGRILDVNSQACAMLGHGREQLLSMRLPELHRPEDFADTRTALEQARSRGSTRFESRFVRADGTLIRVEISARIIDAAEGVVQGIVRDITEQKRLEERVRQMEKMRAIGELAGGIAHDFNNRLVGILGFAQLLEQEADDPRLKDYAGRIIRASRRAKNLTGQLLAFARKGDYRVTSVNLHHAIDEVVMFLEHTLHKKIRIRRRFGSRSPFTRGDPAQLQNVFLNLALNARDAMPDGGELVFETRDVDLDADYCRRLPYEFAPGSYVLARVSDTGVGMDEDVRRHIFEPFFTTKKRGEGTGMGLAAVYGTVKNHGGAIEVESRPGEGAVFSIYLPRIAAGERAAESEQAAASLRRRGHVLVIDDEEDVLDFVRLALERAGCRVTAFSSGAEAVEYFRERHAEVDLVLLDMIMEEMDGEAVFAALRRVDPGVCIVIVTGYAEKDDLRGSLRAKAAGFVSKPFEVRALYEVVNRIIGD